MTTETTFNETFCVPARAWSRPSTVAASFVGAIGYPLAVPAAASAKHTQKRLAMAGTDIDGWPLGPADGTSG